MKYKGLTYYLPRTNLAKEKLEKAKKNFKSGGWPPFCLASTCFDKGDKIKCHTNCLWGGSDSIDNIHRNKLLREAIDKGLL
jgi:hypothetical protein